VEGVNVYDLLRYDHLILTQEALRGLEERLAA
jgi:ribosomal protein L4